MSASSNAFGPGGLMSVEVVGGPVAPTDQAYAREKLEYLGRHAPRAMHGRARLCADRNDTGSAAAAADAVLILDADLVLCAGAVARTMREAIDEVSARLHRRLVTLREDDARDRVSAYSLCSATSRASSAREPMSSLR